MMSRSSQSHHVSFELHFHTFLEPMLPRRFRSGPPQWPATTTPTNAKGLLAQSAHNNTNSTSSRRETPPRLESRDERKLKNTSPLISRTFQFQFHIFASPRKWNSLSSHQQTIRSRSAPEPDARRIPIAVPSLTIKNGRQSGGRRATSPRTLQPGSSRRRGQVREGSADLLQIDRLEQLSA
jgi:hypothetical protein